MSLATWGGMCAGVNVVGERGCGCAVPSVALVVGIRGDVDDALVATDVPGLLYPTELAKSVAADAARIAPQSLAARSAVAAANLAQANLIETSIAQGEDSVSEMAPVAQELKIAALASGVDAIRGALDAGVKQHLAAVAIGAIDTLADAEIIDQIQESTLLGALQSSDKRVQYAAAEAIVRASRGVNVPNLSTVVGVLAQAVTEEKVNTIHVIMPSMDAGGAVKTANAVRGISFTEDASAVSGQLTLLGNPSIDVVVINEILTHTDLPNVDAIELYNPTDAEIDLSG